MTSNPAKPAGVSVACQDDFIVSALGHSPDLFKSDR